MADKPTLAMRRPVLTPGPLLGSPWRCMARTQGSTVPAEERGSVYVD